MPRPRFASWPTSWPTPSRWRLRHQVLLLLTGVCLLALMLLSEFTAKKQSAIADSRARQWATAISTAAATSAADRLALHDMEGLERDLRGLAGLPGVARIEALDAQGLLLVGMSPARERRSWPPDGANVDPGSLEMAWAPVGPDGRDGSVGVSFSSLHEADALRPLRFDAAIAVAVTGLLSIIGLSLLLGWVLAPIRRVAAFARRLAGEPGAQLQDRAASQEVSELTQALNAASITLREQNFAMQSSGRHTQGIIDAVPDAIIGIDAAGLILSASPAVTSIFGHEPHHMVGRPLTELLPELSAQEVENRTLAGLFMRSSGTHVARFQVDAVRHGGTCFPAEVSLARLPSAPNDGPEVMRYACAVRDVTDQRMLDTQLHLYVRALECSSNGVVILDLGLPGRPTIYANAAFTRITGYETGQVVGSGLAFLYGRDVEQPEMAELDAAMNEGRGMTVVARHYRADGRLFFDEISVAPVLDENNQPRHYICILNDVTERERARLAIAERTARLNAIFDLSPDGFVVFDREGQLVYGNEAFFAMTGWSDALLVEGLSLQEFDQRLQALCASQAAYPVTQLPTGDDESLELLHLTRPRPCVLTRLTRHNAGGQGESILYFRDVTHETEVDRMKSEFLTTAAHELRTPMVSVFGFTELLLHRPVNEVKRRDVLETIHRQSSLLIAMINDLLDLARIESRQGRDLQREQVPLNALVTDTVDRMRGAMATHELKMELEEEHEDAILWIDPIKTSQALTNVLSNAMKYSPAGSVLHVSSLQREGMLGVRVRDHGIGMTPQQLARVFERFYRADPSGNIPGTGLGMSLVKEIVEQQDGHVDIQSEPAIGTTVTLWLPAAVAPKTPSLAYPSLPAS